MPNHRSVDKMSKKWYETAQNILDPGDQILKTYPLKMNGKYGWLIISSSRLLFLHETGFIQKNYSLIFDKKREHIKQVHREGIYDLSIIDNVGNVSKCSFELPSEIIHTYLGKWLDTSIPMPENKSTIIHA